MPALMELEDAQRRLEKTSANTKDVGECRDVLARHRREISAVTVGDAVCEYAQKTLGGGDSGLSVNTQYVVEQVAESSGQSAAELRPLAGNVSQMNAEHISRAADCLQTLGYTMGQALSLIHI